MNRNERLSIWNKLHSDAAASLAETDRDFPGIDAVIVENIRAGRAQSVAMTAGWVKFYS
jgi:hypothetical protein